MNATLLNGKEEILAAKDLINVIDRISRLEALIKRRFNQLILWLIGTYLGTVVLLIILIKLFL